jgi:RNA polymerase sigma factor (sigma-70 family)
MDLAEYIIKSENSRLIYSLIKKLPPLESKVLHLMYFENMSYNEISEILEVPVKKLYEISRTAKEKLEKQLKS